MWRVSKAGLVTELWIQSFQGSKFTSLVAERRRGPTLAEGREAGGVVPFPVPVPVSRSSNIIYL